MLGTILRKTIQNSRKLFWVNMFGDHKIKHKKRYIVSFSYTQGKHIKNLPKNWGEGSIQGKDTRFWVFM